MKAMCRVATTPRPVTCLIAGKGVNVEGASQDMLINIQSKLHHPRRQRMPLCRINHGKPILSISPVSLEVSASWPAYRKLVHTVRVGAEPAHAVYGNDEPAPKSGQVGLFVKTARTDLVHGCNTFVQEVAKGYLVPTIMVLHRKSPQVAAPSQAGTPA
jgi:hypothetical protein